MKKADRIQRNAEMMNYFLNSKPSKKQKQKLVKKYNLTLERIMQILEQNAVNLNSIDRETFKIKKHFFNLKLDFDQIEYSYQYGKNHNWNKADMLTLCNKFNITLPTLNQYIEDYIKLVLKISNVQNEKPRSYNQKKYPKNNSFEQLYYKVLNAQSDDEVIKLCLKSQEKHYQFNAAMDHFCLKLHKTTHRPLEEIRNEILNLFSPYLIYHQEEIEQNHENKLKQNRNLQIKTAQNMITEFINSSLSSKEYFARYRKSAKSYYICIIKKYDPQLYNKYIERISNENNNQKELSEKKAKELLIQLQENPHFDIIDYYIIINYDFKEVSQGINHLYNQKEITLKQVHLAKTFIDNNSIVSRKSMAKKSSTISFNEIDLDTILQEQISFLVNNEKRTITDEEKTNIYHFLIDNEIPVNRKTYSTCVRRLIKGTNHFKHNTKIHT